MANRSAADKTITSGAQLRSIIGTAHPGVTAAERRLIDRALRQLLAAPSFPITAVRPPVQPLVYVLRLATTDPKLQALYGDVISTGAAPWYIGSSKTGSRIRDHVRSLTLAKGLRPHDFEVSIIPTTSYADSLALEERLIDVCRPVTNMLGGFGSKGAHAASTSCSNFDALHYRWGPRPAAGQLKLVKALVKQHVDSGIVRPIWPAICEEQAA